MMTACNDFDVTRGPEEDERDDHCLAGARGHASLMPFLLQSFRAWRSARWTLAILCLTLTVGIGVAGVVLTGASGIYLLTGPESATRRR